MSVWTNIEGKCDILKRNRVSIRDVINEICDENVTHTEAISIGHIYRHRFQASICLDLIEINDDLLALPLKLKALPGTFDISVEGRILK